MSTPGRSEHQRHEGKQKGHENFECQRQEQRQNQNKNTDWTDLTDRTDHVTEWFVPKLAPFFFVTLSFAFVTFVFASSVLRWATPHCPGILPTEQVGPSGVYGDLFSVKQACACLP